MWTLNPTTGVLGRKEGVIWGTEPPRGEGLCRWTHRSGWCGQKPRVAWRPPRTGPGQRDPPLEPLEGAQPCPHLDHRFLTRELGGNEFVLKLSSLWPVAAATPGHWEWTCWLQGENSGRTHPLPPNPNTQSCHEVKWVHTHRWLNRGLTLGSQPASLPPPRHHHRHCEGPSSTHSVDIQGPDAGSEASELGGSTQGSPCLLGPHGQGLCSDTEVPGEARSSGRGRHGRLSIRGGGLSRVHPGGLQPFTQSGGRTPCGTQCPVASPCHGRLWAEPWMTRSLHLTRGRGWHWGNPQWGFFFKKPS